jgi:hypothetical protein
MGKIPKVTLMVQCKVDGIWKKVPAPMSANGRPKNVPGASFYLRYRRKGKDTWEAVEGGPDAAMAAKKRRELSFEAEAIGIDIPELRKDANADRLTCEQAVNLYFSDEVPEEGELPEWNAATEKWSRKTLTAYRHSVQLFRDAHNKTYIQDVSRRGAASVPHRTHFSPSTCLHCTHTRVTRTPGRTGWDLRLLVRFRMKTGA